MHQSVVRLPYLFFAVAFAVAITGCTRATLSQRTSPQDLSSSHAQCYRIDYDDPVSRAEPGLFPGRLALIGYPTSPDSGKVIAQGHPADSIGFWRMFGLPAYWRRVDGDSLVVRFSNGFSSIIARFQTMDSTLSGRATFHSDVIMPPPLPSMRMKGTLESCPRAGAG